MVAPEDSPVFTIAHDELLEVLKVAEVRCNLINR